MPKSLAFPLLIAMFRLASPAQQAAMPPAAAPVEMGSVSGWVVNTATGKPVERAAVVMNPSGAAGGTILRAITGAGGRFAFSTVEPGNYVIGAVRAGFAVAAQPGLQSTGGRVNVTVASGAKVAELKLRLTPAAVISGRVTDEEGAPLPGVSVRLMHPVYVNGQRQLQRIEAINSISDDRGGFRIHDLLPGRYYLVATGGNNGAAFDRYFPAFFPGGTDPSTATLFDVKAGAQLHDKNLILLPARMTRIKGRVIDTTTSQPGAGARILLSPKGSAFNSVSTATGTANAQGEWEMSDIRPGPHTVGAELTRGQDRLVARISADIPPNGMDDIRLLLAPGAEFTGTVRLEGGQGEARFDPSRLRVQLAAQEYDAGVSNGSVTPQGDFTIRSVRPATYDASVTPLPETLYLKSVQVEKEETINTGIEVADSRSYRLEVTLGGDGAQLEGVVKDGEDKPVGGGTVLLAPADPAMRKMQRLYKTATTTHDGKYILKGIPPGSYHLYSFEEIDPGVWFEADFLPPYQGKAVSISLAPNGRSAADLKLLRLNPEANSGEGAAPQPGTVKK
jgi:hypothetical protein